MSGIPFIVAAVGLDFEAKIAAAPGVLTVRCPPEPASDAILHAAVAQDCRGIISFGIAGGLDPALRPGDGVVASTVRSGDKLWAADEEWSDVLLRRIPGARLAPIVGTAAPVLAPDDKRALYRATHTAVVDTESHVVAAVAARAAIPFVAFRVVADGARDTLPAAALAGRRADGSIATSPVLFAVMKRPREISALVGLARKTWVARRSLAHARRLLGPEFGLSHLV